MNTMIADAPIRTTRLGVGLDANRNRSRDPEAWRRAIGTTKVSARLALLPEGESRWNRIGVSAVAQILILAFFVALPLFFPERLKVALNMAIVPLAMPVTEVPVAPPPPPIKPKAVTPKPEVVPPPIKLSPKQPHIFVQAKAFQPKATPVEVKAPEVKMALEEAKIDTSVDQPKRPKEDVKMNNLNTGSAAPATIKAPIDKVQTGGFGDPNGLPGKGNPNKTTNVNRLGSPALPGGPGYGNGTGGDKGKRGTVASTGFGNGIANPPEGGKRQGSVQTSGFANESASSEAPKKKAAPADAPDTAVNILDKPKPEYTAEGRSLKLEGDVVLDMIFKADGTVHVNRVVSGLGHGLDESAVRAAQQMKFKPAKRDGQSVDFPARVRIEFRMAY